MGNLEDLDSLEPLDSDPIFKGDDILLNDDDEFVPMSQSATDEIKNKDSNFVFFFGTAAAGKSVILCSMLYYMNTRAGVLRPNLKAENSRDAKVLMTDFFEDIRRGKLPTRTKRDRVLRLDLVFEPNNKSRKVPPINLTFLETSGENHQAITRGGKYHSSIDNYLNAKIPLTFIIVTSYDRAHKEDTLINEFLDELERKGQNLKVVNVIVVISKWDKSGNMVVSSEEQLDTFISERLSMTYQRVNTYGLTTTYYTIGSLKKDKNNGEERIEVLRLDTAEKLSKWLYKSIVGYPLDYEGTFWERIKFNLFS